MILGRVIVGLCIAFTVTVVANLVALSREDGAAAVTCYAAEEFTATASPGAIRFLVIERPEPNTRWTTRHRIATVTTAASEG